MVHPPFYTTREDFSFAVLRQALDDLGFLVVTNDRSIDTHAIIAAVERLMGGPALRVNDPIALRRFNDRIAVYDKSMQTAVA